uniref:DDE Tnp4 domain-containing protein n=1 Tax=Lactuca sativa TaxID=4236 RepID=A0A9R1XJA5_LACSA|nr:hypothetical protein LSAT_V11C300117690 [Lactuca sativa]
MSWFSLKNFNATTPNMKWIFMLPKLLTNDVTTNPHITQVTILMDSELQTPAQFLRVGQRQAVHMLFLLMAILTHRALANTNRPKLPSRKLILKRQRIREQLLHDLSNDVSSLLRNCALSYNKLVVFKLLNACPLKSMLQDLHIVGNDFRNRFVSWLYRRSISTTSRCFHRALRAIISLESAIDGTRVRVKVPNKDAPRYRGRKGYPTINVLAACTFDLKFTYILSGWEGTTSDSRILKNALNREDKLVITKGQYYLIDAGLPHTTTLMTPYHGVRYHLKEYSAQAPENAKELFNLCHASLRNAIERAFGVLKRRFPIIRRTQEPFYSCETQSDIFLACCILHNFLLEEDRDKNLENEVLQEKLNEPREEMRNNIRKTKQMRNLIANQMWTDYLPNRNQEIDMSMELLVKMMKEEKVTKKKHIKWKDWMDYCFIQSMMTQDEKGLRISGSFIPQAYSNMVEELNQKFGKSLTKSHLKNRLKPLKSGFSQWYDMFRGTSLSGFGWNSETQLIEADEEVWANLINTEDIKVETIEEVDQLLASNDITLEKQKKNNDHDDDVLFPTCFSPMQNSSSKKYKTKKRKHEIEDEDEPEVEPDEGIGFGIVCFDFIML